MYIYHRRQRDIYFTLFIDYIVFSIRHIPILFFGIIYLIYKFVSRLINNAIDRIST